MSHHPNILVIRLGLLGDMVCTTPMLEAIKTHFPEGRLCLLSNAYNSPVVARNPHVDKLYTYIHSKDRQRNPRQGFFASLIDAWRLKRDLKRERFDWIVVCNGGFNKASVRTAQRLGGKIISATREDGSYEYRVDFPVSGLLAEPIQHEVERTFKLLVPMGIKAHEQPAHLSLLPDQAALDVMRVRLQPNTNQPHIAIHISSRDPRREWPVARFAAVIQEINQALPAQFWIIHAPDDMQRAQSLSQALPGISNQLVSPANTDELIATLTLATLTICQEGGVLHLAAGVQTPVIGLFENTPEKIQGWYPWGCPHRLVTNPMPMGLIKDIAAADVAAAVLDIYKEILRKP